MDDTHFSGHIEDIYENLYSLFVIICLFIIGLLYPVFFNL